METLYYVEIKIFDVGYATYMLVTLPWCYWFICKNLFPQRQWDVNYTGQTTNIHGGAAQSLIANSSGVRNIQPGRLVRYIDTWKSAMLSDNSFLTLFLASSRICMQETSWSWSPDCSLVAKTTRRRICVNDVGDIIVVFGLAAATCSPTVAF